MTGEGLLDGGLKATTGEVKGNESGRGSARSGKPSFGIRKDVKAGKTYRQIPIIFHFAYQLSNRVA